MQNPVGGSTEVQRVNQEGMTIAKVRDCRSRLCRALPFCSNTAAPLNSSLTTTQALETVATSSAPDSTETQIAYVAILQFILAPTKIFITWFY